MSVMSVRLDSLNTTVFRTRIKGGQDGTGTEGSDMSSHRMLRSRTSSRMRSTGTGEWKRLHTRNRTC